MLPLTADMNQMHLMEPDSGPGGVAADPPPLATRGGTSLRNARITLNGWPRH